MITSQADAEREAARLVAERAEDPDGPIGPERMERGLDVAEALAGQALAEHSKSGQSDRERGNGHE